jgi:hypothetical protein
VTILELLPSLRHLCGNAQQYASFIPVTASISAGKGHREQTSGTVSTPPNFLLTLIDKSPFLCVPKIRFHASRIEWRLNVKSIGQNTPRKAGRPEVGGDSSFLLVDGEKKRRPVARTPFKEKDGREIRSAARGPR